MSKPSLDYLLLAAAFRVATEYTSAPTIATETSRVECWRLLKRASACTCLHEAAVVWMGATMR